MAEPHAVTLAHPADVAGFRCHARALLAAGVAPPQVSWFVAGDATADLFSVAATADLPRAPAPAPPPQVPAFFPPLCQQALLHRDPARFGLLYRLLWRLQHEPGLRHDALDADRLRAAHLAQAVRRDLHKMKAFVRFTRVGADPAATAETDPLHVAWFEPEHHITEAIAPFFVRRFTHMRWVILTPERSLHWNGTALQAGPGAQRSDAPPPDAGEALWLTYYANVFNPARLKLAMMQKEMPRRYWHNLPEAALISPLAAHAAQRSAQMIAQAPSTPARRIRPPQALAKRG